MESWTSADWVAIIAAVAAAATGIIAALKGLSNEKKIDQHEAMAEAREERRVAAQVKLQEKLEEPCTDTEEDASHPWREFGDKK